MVLNLLDGRTKNFRRNDLLEKLLAELNSDLQPSEKMLMQQYQGSLEMSHPLILLMGPLRSGSTLFMQWLANTDLVAYPTNLLSRFYQAPIIGAKIQLILTDPRFSFRDELGEFLQRVDYLSENGKTEGALAPNEFWYFWRRFLAEPEKDVWTDNELLKSMDKLTMLAELTGIMQVLQKPFVAKGMLFNYNIPVLDSVFEKVLFVHIKRDLVTNVASVLDARKRQLGTEASWYSFKIPEYDQLKNLDPVTQATGQVYYINKAIETGLHTVTDSRKLVVRYEEFCQSPESVFVQLKKKLSLNQDVIYLGPSGFSQSREPEYGLSNSVDYALNKFAHE